MIDSMAADEYTRYRRLWFDFEIEVVDEAKLPSPDALELEGDATVGERVAAALNRALVRGLDEDGPQLGLRWTGHSGTREREVSSPGADDYDPVRSESVPRRRNDGRYSDEDLSEPARDFGS